MTRNLVCAAVLLAQLVSVLFGQATGGTVVGTVTDQAGAVVPGATITIVSDATQFTRVTISSAQGQYSAYAIPTGTLTVAVEHPGFEKLIRSGAVLTAGDTLTVNLQLQIGNVQQSVEVTGEAGMVQSQNATVSTLINNTQTLEMPLNERSFTTLLQLSAGASPSTPGLPSSLTGYSMRGSNSISMNGATANNNAYLIDGLYNRMLWVNGIVLDPVVDAIQETRIMASDYSAQYGNSAGAVALVTTKSGTNEFHGSGFQFLRNSDLDANTFFNNRAGKAIAPFRRNEFGGTLGGPIRKDRTFIFGDYQGIRWTQPATQVDTIPTLAQRQMVQTGDFSSLGNIIYDPTNLVVGPNGAPTRMPFTGNRIPAQRLDPAAVKVMQLLPVPTSSGNTNNFTFNPVGTQRDDQFDFRADQSLFRSDRLFFKFSYDNTRGVAAGTLPVGQNSIGADIGQYLTGGGPSIQKNWSTTLSYTKVLSATTVNEARIGLLRNWLEIYNDDTSHNTAASLGIPNVNISDTNGGIPNLVISGGFTQIGNSNSFPEFTRAVSGQADDVLTNVKGTHTLKFGGDFVRHQFDGHTSIAPRGQYAFQGAFTRQIGAGGSATALADFALGASTTILRSEQFGFWGLRQFDTAAFAEDAWRVNSRLTLTYGVRYEIQAPPYEVFNRWSNLNIKTGTFCVAGVADCGLGRRLRNLDLDNLVPRLGIAYVLTSDHQTVLRAGVGESVFEATNGGRALHSNPPMNIVQQFAYDLNGPPGLLLSQGIPLPVQANLFDPTQLTGLYYSFDPNMQTNRSWQMSAGIQREILPRLLLDVAFVRTRTLDMTNGIVGNQAVPGPGPLGPRRPLYSTNPALGDIDYRTNYGSAKYNSLQVKVQKRYALGLTGSLVWTWSHNMSDTNGANSTTRPQSSNCFSCDYGNLAEDRRHMVVINHVYELPFGTGRQFATKGVLTYIIGNWDVTGVWTMYTGMHFGPNLASSVSNSLGGISPAPVERPNLIGTPNLPSDQRMIDHWFNVTAFQSPAQFTLGNAGVGILVGPGYFNLDTGLHRTFPIKEKMKLTFRWEMFNAFNHSNFQNPNASIGAATAGVVSATYPSRVMQIALKLNF